MLLDSYVIGVQVYMNDRPLLLHVSPGPIRLCGPLANRLPLGGSDGFPVLLFLTLFCQIQ